MKVTNGSINKIDELRQAIISNNLLSVKLLLKEIHQDESLKKYFEEEFFIHFINLTLKSSITLDIILDISENYTKDLESLFGLFTFIKNSSSIDNSSIDQIISSFKVSSQDLKNQPDVKVFILKSLYIKPFIYEVLKKHQFTSDLSPKQHLEIIKLYREYSLSSFINEDFFNSYFKQYPLKATIFFVHSFVQNLDVDSSIFKNHEFIFNLITSTYQQLSISDRKKVFIKNEKHLLDEQFPGDLRERSIEELNKIKSILSKIDLYEKLQKESPDKEKNNLLRQKI